MIIQVTPADIALGAHGQPNTCPIARAVRAASGASYVRVEANRILVGDKSFRAPRSARRFVQAFDSHRPVSPFAFRLA